MNLQTDSATTAIRRQAVDWLKEWLPDDYEERSEEYRLDLKFRSAYQAAAFDAGWLQPAWGPELGGRNLDEEAELWIKLDFARLGAPKMPNVQGPGVIAHALLGFGTEDQKTLAQPVARGDVWWCLGMSEPEAGSDLASMRTTARQWDETFRISGQKVWTSHARDAQYCLLFARTQREGPPHRGISAFILPMESDGITVRPIQKIGPQDEEFCEMFLDDVELPYSALLGDMDTGWKVAMTSLGHERDMIWIMNLVEIERALSTASGVLSESNDQGALRQLGRLRATADSIWLTGLRGLASRLAGGPGHETTLLKVISTEAAQDAFLFAGSVAGPASLSTDLDRKFGGELIAGEIEALGATLYGGTSEIQRNIIGERVLGLPR